jgi:hypothetical protein
MGLRRSPQEIRFRLAQEAWNLWLAAFPPEFPPVPQAAFWPRPAAPGQALARRIEALAQDILAHRFPVLGITLETGPDIDWRKDYVYGQRSEIRYFRRLPYLNFAAVGDHKVVWELSRHQHLVLLAQAWSLAPRPEYLAEIERQLTSWWTQNPFQRSIHWCSALEVAFRAWSWLWLDHLVGAALPAEFRARLLNSLGQHGCHLEHNLSVYFSPNTHLLGEALVLHALGVLYPDWPRSRRWIELGGAWVRRALRRQVQSDGAHFEQSAYYHIYALDMFLAHYLLAGRPEEFRPVLIAMAEFLDHLMGAGRSIPLIGDDDGGRLFFPYGERAEFGCATLATCAVLFDRPEWLRDPGDLDEQALWWLGPVSPPAHAPATHASRLFAASGLAVLRSGPHQVIFDTGAFGAGGAGHSHADTLQVLVRKPDVEWLLDPGTYTYIADPVARHQFRGTAAHNTLQMDALDQATPAGPFRWNHKPEVRRTAFTTAPDFDFAEALCRYSGFTHRRRLAFGKPDWLVIFDDLEGPPGPHTLQLAWHCGVPVQPDAEGWRLGADLWLWSSLPLAPGEGWRSPAFLSRLPAPVLTARHETPLPYAAVTVVLFRRPLAWPVLNQRDGTVRLGSLTLRFPSSGGCERPVVASR